MAEGWISIHRQICDNWVWQDKPFAMGQAWIDLLLLAYHEDTKRVWRGEMKEYKRGTVNVSITFLADRWGWSWRRVRRFLNILEKEGMIVQNVTARNTAIFLTKYDDFQGERRADVRANVTPDVTPNVRADVRQSIMINNDNNDNNTRQRRGTSHRKSDMDRISEIIAQMKEEEDENGDE